MDKPKRGYKQAGMSFGEGTGGVDFSKGRTGAYSTADGKLMSGTQHGGAVGTDMLGNTRDVEMGSLNRKGEMRIYGQYSKDAYDHERGVALTSGKTMADHDSKALYGTTSKTTPDNTPADMPDVNVGGGTGDFNDSDHGADLGNYHMKKSKDITRKAAGIKASWGGGALSKRQQKRLEKGGAKAERQLARIERKRDRKKRRAERRGTDWRV